MKLHSVSLYAFSTLWKLGSESLFGARIRRALLSVLVCVYVCVCCVVRDGGRLIFSRRHLHPATTKRGLHSPIALSRLKGRCFASYSLSFCLFCFVASVRGNACKKYTECKGRTNFFVGIKNGYIEVPVVVQRMLYSTKNSCLETAKYVVSFNLSNLCLCIYFRRFSFRQ